MKQRIRKTGIYLASMLVVLSAVAVLGVGSVSAQASKSDVCAGIGVTTNGNGCATASGTPNIAGVIATVVNILSVIAGVAAVIMIIIGGLRYITSGGDGNSVSAAKKTIIYAIVGLIVVALAQAIVRFTISKLV